eukprot:gene11315-23673_t
MCNRQFDCAHSLSGCYCIKHEKSCWISTSGADRPGNNLKSFPRSTLSSCMEMCMTETKCVSIAMDSSAICYIKYSRSDLVSSPDMTIHDYICHKADQVIKPYRKPPQSLKNKLNILFYHPYQAERIHQFSYDALHSKSGFSGTETALLEVSLYLAHREFVSNFYLPRTTYCSDYRIIGNGIAEYFITNTTTSTTTSTTSITTNSYDSFSFSKNLNDAILAARRGRWFFHARYYRGGDMTQVVFNKIKQIRPEAAKEIHYSFYDTADDFIKSDEKMNRIIHGSLSKKSIAILLNNMEYFVYSLAHHESHVHHDTFGTVILEALACGVLVISWDVACLKEIYGDLIELLPTKTIEGNNQSYFPTNRYGFNKWMFTSEAINTIVNAIIALDKNPYEKNRRRLAGIEFAKKYTWDEIGKQYAQWLESL